MKRFVSILLVILLCIPATGQAPRKKKAQRFPMYYEVYGTDTVYFDSLDPVWVFPRGRRGRAYMWRGKYRLVYNFNKVYPYALAGRRMMAQVDSTIAADVTKKSQRSQYTHDVEVELLRLFEKDVRNMSFSQGMVLIRLIDRECGMPPYNIIKNYRSGFAADFWQVVAKIFGADLKRRYDPAGSDRDIESLVKIWDSGKWEEFYFSIFMEPPKRTVIRTEELDSKVRKR